MLNVLLWLVAVEAVGLAVFPLCYRLLPHLRDRGFAVSKPLGILLIAYLSWILSVLRLVPSVQVSIAALLLTVGVLGWTYMWPQRRQLLEFASRERVGLIAGELVFLVVFFAFVTYRAYDPDISHTEAPMDFMFLNASIVSDLGPPEDPWLRGGTVSYYYFGYWMMGVLSQLTGIASSISYNLSLALVPALGAAGAFGLVYNMVGADSRRLRHAVVGGVAAAFLLVGTANLEGALEFARANGVESSRFWEWVGIEGLDGPAPTLAESWRPDEFWWWWRASRVISSYDGGGLIDQPIEEFPFFSYILGDLHPHVMSVPFVLLFLTLCFGFYRSPAHVWRRLSPDSYGMVLLLALALGGLAFTNMWDMPVFAATLLAVACLRAYSAGGGSFWSAARNGFPLWALVVGIAVLAILPYLLTFTSQVTGMGAVASASTRPLHLLIVWALFLVAVSPFVLGVFWRTTVRADWARLSLVASLVGFVPYVVWAFLFLEDGGSSSVLAGRLFHVLPFALLVGIAVYGALWLATESSSSPGKSFALVLSALGVLLVMGPELLYVDDSFGGQWERMNTVFKLYYQGWAVLAVASGFAIYYWGSVREYATGPRRALVHLWAVAFVVLLIGSLYYPPAAAATKGDLFNGEATLNGLAFIGREGPEYMAIQEIRRLAGPDSAVLEAVGGDYSDFGRISASTGVPTVLGWPGHQLQWRGSTDPFEGRGQDVEAIYQTSDVEEAKTLLGRYRVDYVYVGAREREAYGPEGLGKFASFMETVFQQGDVTVYRLPQ